MQMTERLITLEEFYALPETVLPCQLIEGRLVMAPAPDRFHQRLVGIIHGEMYACVRDNPGLGELYVFPFDVQFTGLNVYQPDVMFFRHDHLDRLSDKRAMGRPGPRGRGSFAFHGPLRP
jgi:Uma2 family endonuclease